MTSKSTPLPQGMPSYWRTEPGHLDTYRSTTKLPEQSDLVVIGGGFSAASLLTHFIAEHRGSSLPSIVVLEARQLASGATGRNGGHCKPDSYYSIARHAKEHSLEAAAEVAAFELGNLRAVSEYITQEGIDCDLVVTRAMDVQLSDSIERDVKQAYDRMTKTGIDPLKSTFEIPKRYIEKITGVKGARSAYSYTSAHLWPYKFIHHMFAKALRHGVNLQTETPVTRISNERDAQGYWTVYTDRGHIRTRTVVVTTNAYTAAILPEYKDKIIPYKAMACRIACPPDNPTPPPLLTNSYALRFSSWDFDYLIPRPDGSIIVGGARSQYLPHLEDWYDNADDSTLVERARTYFDGYMQRHFRGWEASGATVTDIWTGVMGYSSDRLPRVGPIPNRPGIYVMAGFTGHGMPQIFLTAKGVAGMIRHGLPFRQSGIPRLFEETNARLKASRNEVRELWDAASGGQENGTLGAKL